MDTRPYTGVQELASGSVCEGPFGVIGRVTVEVIVDVLVR
jgi:hypothetical protein